MKLKDEEEGAQSELLRHDHNIAETEVNLPKNLYPGRLAFLFRNKVFRRVFFGGIILITLLSILVVLLGISVALIPIVFIGLLILSLIPPAFRPPSLSQTAKLEFLKEVAIQRPALSVDAWDVVAAHMNEYLFTKGVTSKPDYYFDGDDCHGHFRQLFMNTFTRIDPIDNSTAHQNHENATESSQQKPRTRYDSNAEIRPIIDEAVKLHEESIKQYWKEQIQTTSSQHPEDPLAP
ncbi:LAFE_0B07800g1_1 [Lachancea fermentati]|uniref:LAFE_0B07800g1_1 n=1 Tax=Lachancea fermentati TaxID=4955 RepID=A0A1G4M886_LACFM|nr:LAFE_0B07800g1_1 [Lachancea fermentati]